MQRKVHRGLYAEKKRSGKRDSDFRFVVVEYPEVWLNNKDGVIGKVVVYRTYQGLDNIRQCMPVGQFMNAFNFVSTRIVTRVERTEESDLSAIRRYKEAHSVKQPSQRKAKAVS